MFQQGVSSGVGSWSSGIEACCLAGGVSLREPREWGRSTGDWPICSGGQGLRLGRGCLPELRVGLLAGVAYGWAGGVCPRGLLIFFILNAFHLSCFPLSFIV